MQKGETGEIKIRRMTRDDIKAILAMGGKIVGERIAPRGTRDIVVTVPGDPLDMSFVAEIGNNVIGAVIARVAYVGIPFSEVCLIHGIVVDPIYQRRGIGSKLINRLLDHCHAEGISPVRALVSERDSQLKQFVEGLGFRRSNIINYDRASED